MTLKESAQKIVDHFLQDEEFHFTSGNEHFGITGKANKKWQSEHIVHDLRRLKHAIESGELDGRNKGVVDKKS
jgi:hypothetical protein